MRLPSKQYTVIALACTAVASLFFHSVAGFPVQASFAIALILWAVIDGLSGLSFRRATRGRWW